jgi:hypothetical protein
MRNSIVVSGCQKRPRVASRSAALASARGTAKTIRGAAAGGTTSTRIVTALTGAGVAEGAQQGCIAAARRMWQTRGVGITGNAVTTAIKNSDAMRLTTRTR